jgi:O-antigen ligase
VLGIWLGRLDPFSCALVVGALAMMFIVAIRQIQLAAVFIVAVHLYVDWYLSLRFVALGMTLLLLLMFFLARSPHNPWKTPRALWLWVPFLILAIFPAARGVTLSDGFTYYLTVIFCALFTFWFGVLITRDAVCLRRLLAIIAGFGALIAIHTLIQATTGILLFGSPRYDQYLAQVSNYELFSASNIVRAGSFFVNPDWSGAFFGMMLFVPLGLFFESSSLAVKTLYLCEALLMLLALLYTYSTGAWVASITAMLVFLALVGTQRSRILLLSLIVVVSAGVLVLFPAQVGFQLQHATGSTSLSIRIGAWQTAIHIIKALPITGIGLGLYAYLYRAEPYRVLAQYRPLAHPHNAYLELGAMAGLPVLILFIALLVLILWWALRNWAMADIRTRALLGGGIASVVALSINSLSINGWTLAPLSATGWLIFGAISSPFISKSIQSTKDP